MSRLFRLKGLPSLCILVFILCRTFTVISQNQYVITRYSQAEGLGSSLVKSIVEDEKGYIWLGAEDGLTRFDGYSFRSYLHDPTDSNSLSDNEVSRCYLDQNYNIIIQTATALSLYNVAQDNFRKILSFSDSVRVLSLGNGSDNEIWITIPHYLVKYDLKSHISVRYEMKNYNLEDEKELKTYAGKAGKIWLVSDHKMVCFFSETNSFEDVGAKSFIGNTNFSGFNSGIIIPENGSGEYIYTKSGLLKYDDHDHSFHLIKENNLINSSGDVFRAYLFNDGKFIYISCESGTIYKVSLQSGEEEKMILHNRDWSGRSGMKNISASSKILDHCIWFNTDGVGLFRFDISNLTVEEFQYNPNNIKSLSSNSISTIFIDHSGVLWASCRSEGICKIETVAQIFTPFASKNGKLKPEKFENLNVRGVAELDENHILLATLEGLFSFSLKDSTFSNYIPWQGAQVLVEERDATCSVLVDKSGMVWVGKWGSGLVLICDIANKKTAKIYLKDESPTGNANNIIRTICEDQHGNILLGSGNGLFKINPKLINWSDPQATPVKSFFHNDKDSSSISDNTVYTIYADHKDRIWIGTKNGLNIFNETSGKFKQFFSTKNGEYTLRTNNIRSLTEDHTGTIWVGSGGGGLHRFNEIDSTFTAFTTNNGLPNNTIYDIEEDKYGRLWLSTNNGLSCFDYNTLTCRNFGEVEGLQNVEFNTNAGIRTSKGLLIFGGVSGFNYFSPEILTEKKNKEPIVISSVKISDREIAFDSTELILNHKDNYISFEFVPKNHFRSQDNLYAYKLEPNDSGWSFSGSRHSVAFSNLSPGHYVFHVKVINGLGSQNSETTVPFYIRPPWYQTPIAIIGFVIAGVALFIIIYRTQRKRVLRLERSASRIREAELKSNALEEKNRRTQVELEKVREVEQAYQQLKATQLQLIEQEKLASLGQLVAGIAHEIKNPLNFINNFSEISKELIEEAGTTTNEDERAEIMSTLKINLDKIEHHGKRADSIVQNMLMHSRGNSGERKLTDINKLCDEYCDLSYHGMRANEREFNCAIQKSFDPDLPEINIVQQDFGRVILNLLNNAFQAVYEKSKSDKEYKPKIHFSTEKKNKTIHISIEDNGPGIPESYRKKIFEPFFTTKPSGKGTGLGLSLSYDIITKEHNGTIAVDSKPGEYTRFNITLPI